MGGMLFQHVYCLSISATILTNGTHEFRYQKMSVMNAGLRFQSTLGGESQWSQRSVVHQCVNGGKWHMIFTRLVFNHHCWTTNYLAVHTWSSIRKSTTPHASHQAQLCTRVYSLKTHSTGPRFRSTLGGWVKMVTQKRIPSMCEWTAMTHVSLNVCSHSPLVDNQTCVGLHAVFRKSYSYNP